MQKSKWGEEMNPRMALASTLWVVRSFKMAVICFFLGTAGLGYAKTVSCSFSKVNPGTPIRDIVQTKVFEIPDSTSIDQVTAQWREYAERAHGTREQSRDYDGRYCDEVQAPVGSASLSSSNVITVEWKPSVRKQSGQMQVAQAGTPKPSQKANERMIAYGPNRQSCLKHGMTATGYITYTNVCKTTVEFGYCNVIAKDENDTTICRPTASSFSRSSVNYVAQGGALKPGETHTFAYRYPRGQIVFMVACPNSFALIETFDSKDITPTSKAGAACWRYVDKN
jgi:hypothetical protein